jgi:hypothetical protein
MGRPHIRDTTFLPRCSAAHGGAGGHALPQPGRDRPPGRQDPSGLPGAGVRRRLRRLRIGELAPRRRSRVDFATGIVDMAETGQRAEGQAGRRTTQDQGKPAQGQPAARGHGGAGRPPAAPGRPTDQVFKARGGGQLRISTSAATPGGPRWPSYPRPSAYGFPEADTALRAWLDAMFRGATEHRRNAVG